MAFGQPSGPPASARQVQHLITLVVSAGHADLRDARGALGLTQRQAGGRFTQDEAEALIARLEAGADASGEGPEYAPPPVIDRRQAERVAVLRSMPTDLLAAELQHRGWVVMEP